MSDISYRIEKRPNGYRLIGGRKNKLSPTGWSNFELDFETERKMFSYIIKKTKVLIEEL